MANLFLIYEDERGNNRRVHVNRENFIIGRHPENDLPISSSKLSRDHIEIRRSGAEFTVEDVGSTNGTKLNDAELTSPEVLFDGDVLNLGDGVKIRVEVSSEMRDPADIRVSNGSAEIEAEDFSSGEIVTDEKDFKPADSKPTEQDIGFGKFFLLAPLLLLFVLISAAVAMYVLQGESKTEIVQTNDDLDLPFDDDEDTEQSPEPLPPSPDPSKIPANDVEPTATSTPEITDKTPKSPANSDDEKLEQAAINFMRRIARNDPRPVLTSRQLSVVKAKVGQYRGSSALASNLKNAHANSAAISSLARSKNLKAQFLAGAALAKLGNARGNVLATAESMLEVLDNLNISIGDEVADDGLIAIAAYRQGVAGRFLKMRNTLERLASNNPTASSQRVRTIWFLKDKGKISDVDYEFALRFLAIGAITQNPKGFNVNAEALTL